MVCYHLVCRIIYDLSFYLLFFNHTFFSKGQVRHQRIIGFTQIRTNKANILLGLILSKRLAKVINRVDTSKHTVIISKTLVCPLPILIAKINAFDHKNTHCGDQ